jgi:hypothetical protein
MRSYKILLTLSILLVSLSSAGAQVITATIFGTVNDKTGAVIPASSVTATNVETGLAKKVTANQSGDFRIEFLPVGHYRLDISATGFGPSTLGGITLSVNQELKLDATLTPGAAAESIEVDAAAPIMNSANAEVGTTIENILVTELPIVNRNVYTLLNIVPGVQQNSNQVGLGLPEQHTSINGGIEAGYSGSVNYFLDGGENVTSLRNAGNILPNPDAIQEFRVEADNYSAEYGRFPSGVINVITKSGSNSLHGSAFEFYRNDELNALNWRQTSAKAPLHRNQFGATLGGPVWKDHTFFFASYAGLRETIATFLNNTTFPTLAEQGKTGPDNFSADFTAGTCVTVLSPFNCTPSTASFLRDPYAGKPSAVGTYNTAFACNGVLNTICANDPHLDPTALNLLKTFIPSPNNGAKGYQGSLPTPDAGDDFLIKIDHRLGSAHQFYAMYFNTSGRSLINAGGSAVPYARIQYSWRQQNGNLSDTWTVSPHVVNQSWISYTRAFGARTSIPAQSLADYGSDFVPQGPHTLASIGITNYLTLGDQISGPLAGNNFYAVRDLVSITTGQHNLRLGGEVSLNKDAQYTNLGNYGGVGFSGTAYTTNSFADFVLGLPSGFSQDQPVKPATNTFVYSVFAQDDWRATQRLVVNLGLRYDYQTVPTDPNNFQDAYIPGRQSVVRPTLPAGLLFPGDPGIKRGIASAGPYHISPRVGFALDLFGTGKTVLRGGFGMFWGGVSGNGWNQPSNFQPFSVSGLAFPNVGLLSAAPNPATGDSTYSPIGATLTHPYRNYPGGSPFPYVGTTIINGSTLKVLDVNFHWPYTYQMNLSLQQQLPGGVAVTAEYVGSLGHNLPFLVDVNYPVFYAPGTGPALATGGACPTPATNLCGSTTTAANVLLRRPLNTVGQIQDMKSNIQSNYNALQLVAEKRLGHGISLTSNYVFSKTLTGAGVQTTSATAEDYNNLRLEYGRADTDARHTFSTGAVWQFDYLHHGNFFARQVANGWQLSPIFRMGTGVPLNITNGLDANLDGNGNDRPLLVGNYHPAVRGPNSWFNPAAFQLVSPSSSTPNPAAIDGTTPRNFISAPGYISFDASGARSFTVLEHYRVEFRGEATNVLNHPNLSTPGTSANSAGTFGIITGAGQMRQVQAGVRLTF